MSLISVTGLHVDLSGRTILEDISFSLRPGELVGLIGVNGAGKSTLLRAVLSLVESRGEIALAGRDVRAMTAATRARHVAYLPQEREIGWPVSVERIVALGRTPHRPVFAGQSVEDRRAVASAIARMDLEGFAARPADQLSGGEKARVLIARVLAQETPLILADEPTAGLDPAHQIALMRLFSELAGEGRAIMLSLHDLALAARWCSRLILIDKGAIAADGLPEEVLTAQRLRSVYGIDAFIGERDGAPLVQPLDIATGR